ncbi:hypothetical protein [Ruegeria arenilitoris]|uniref:hypothetical protein n=1 Tax=Ruegeria arenilitoris TaxID=1173585 RepID=UPI00147E355E|nr:hypothetical protein [Ruegeria arenilitoris]
MGLRRILRKLLDVEKAEHWEPNGWLSENVYCQSSQTQLSDIAHLFDPKYTDPDPVNLVHIVNMYSIGGQLDNVQNATLSSMQAARSNPLAGKGNTTIVQVPLGGDEGLLDGLDGVQIAPSLERTVLDIAEFQDPRPLPLLFDILENGASFAGRDDYLVYTNSDICVQPYFYGAVRQLIAAGFDAISINRRTVGNERIAPPDPLALGETGLWHPGHDCFIFSKVVFERFLRTDSCLGKAGVMQPLLFNMVAHADRMLMLKNGHFTFHFGNDAPWRSEGNADYTTFNYNAASQNLQDLARDKKIKNRLRDYCENHHDTWRVAEDGSVDFGA